MMKRGYDNSNAMSLVSFPVQGGGNSLTINTLQYSRRTVDQSPVRRFPCAFHVPRPQRGIFNTHKQSINLTP